MQFDALTLAAVVDELRRTVLGGRIQRVLMPTPLSLALEVYHAGQRVYLLADADPRAARVQLIGARPTRGVERETPLLLLLRKYVRNGMITAIQQPDLERIVVLSILKHRGPRKDDAPDEAADEELRCELVLELLGPRANIVLVDDDNLILDAVRRVPGDGGRRAVLPREVYTLPAAPAGQRDPRRATPADVREALGAGGDLPRALARLFAGVSPQQAREALSRATGDPDAVPGPDLPAAAIAEELRRLWSAPFAPSLAYQDQTPLAFAPYHMTQFPDVRPVASISAALETFYAASTAISGHAQRREALRRRLLDARERLQRQCEALERELARAAALDRLRWEGEMIFAFLHSITPGQRELRVEDQVIRLDPAKTPVENAQARFREYDKAKGALQGVPERLAATEAQVRYLDETMALLELAEGYEAIAAIERELQDQGLLKASGSQRARGPRLAPLRLRSSDGLTILVGRSAGQNEEVTFRLARPDDLWLHVRDMPGAHVVIQHQGQVPERTLLEAAGLAVYFSPARHDTAAEVVVTERRHVKKVSGGAPGLVTYRHERAVRAAPLAPTALEAAVQTRR
ncbi:Rqc2 family fibronectin-binding protein [Kallotenue papyrolyticum]|uniref:Rqc2 family fibronectin-binding protein n=1 Tax=Kallotenue papyrolyticum TaxID=1325125 RepID=UPI0004925F56|nr:fibronectin-binding domain-containing protein [Kallotenue papyrolyticum]